MISDVRHATRTLLKMPGFFVVALLTLALGIGAATAIFSVVNAVLLQPLALKEPDRLMFLQERWQNLYDGFATGNFAHVRGDNGSFASLAASSSKSVTLMSQGLPERIQGELVTAEYFDTAGVAPLLGRVFRADEDRPGHSQVVVVGEKLWRGRLQADPKIVGQTLRIDGTPYTVVGVMPKSFDPLLNGSEVWTPQALTPQQLVNYDNHYLSVIGRLKEGSSLAQAQSELDLIARRLQKDHPFDHTGRDFNAIPLTTALLGDQQLMLWMMLGAVACVLAIACANIANLQLVRARNRQREVALRAALGASPARIVRQLLTENIVLGSAGGVAGVVLAYWGISWIVAYGPANVPRLDQSQIDGATLAFACGATLLSSLLCGLVPALRSASTRLNDQFKGGARTSSGTRDRLRSGLVVGEMAIALMLMAGAGLLIRSALMVSRVDPGFDTANVIVGRAGLPEAEYQDSQLAHQTFERIAAAAATLPGVQTVGLVSRAPMAGGSSSNGLVVEGKPIEPANIINARLQIVSPSYFTATRLPLKQGREFTQHDTRDKVLVAIINETLARTLFPGESPLGRRFACCEPGPKGRLDPVWHEIVGVIADVKAAGLDRQAGAEFYLPLAQIPPQAWDWIQRTMDLVIRTEGAQIPAQELRTVVASVAPAVPVYGISTMQQKISSTLEKSRFDTFLLAIFAATALLLSSLGIYGVLSYTVAQRTRAIGVQMALGATQRQVMSQVLTYGIKLTCLGLAMGLACAIAGTRLLSSFLYGVHASDAVTFVSASIMLIAVALAASYMPARRAMRVDPLVALRTE